MNGMLGAIKSRRGGLLGDDQEMGDSGYDSPQEPEGDDKLKGLVDALSEDQKAELLQLLVKDQSANEDAPAIEKGKMGPGEEQELAQYAGDDENADHESEDEIAESMLSSADKMRADQGAKPSGLGQRMRMGLANKLKKG